MEAKDFPLILNTDQACALLGCEKKYLYRQINAGKIPARWVGKGWRFHRDVLLRYVAEGDKIEKCVAVGGE